MKELDKGEILLIFVDIKDKKVVDYTVVCNNGRKNIILLNPAEYFIYQTAKKNKLTPDDVCYDLYNAKEFVRYRRLGELISSFFFEFNSYFCGMDEDIFRKFFKRNIVFKVPFSELDLETIGCVLWSVYSDLGDIVVEEQKNIPASIRKKYLIKDIKQLLFDRFNVELDCCETDEELYNKYVEEDKHSLIRESEKVIWAAVYPINSFITRNFDLKNIKRRIHNL